MVFCHLQETGIDAAKTASKRVFKKTAEATGDLNYFNMQRKRKVKNKQIRKNLHSTSKKTTNY